MLFRELTDEEIARLKTEEGREEGREEGEFMKLIELVLKKVAKKQSIEQIADAVEEESEIIRTIMEAIKTNPNATKRELYDIIVEKI